MKRRTFLTWSAGSVALLQGCNSTNSSGNPDARTITADADPVAADADPLAPDADPNCRPTRDDALGPFFESGAPMRTQIAEFAEPGERLALFGTVVADNCKTAVAGVLIDIWQADRNGAYHDAGTEYRLRGQVLTDSEGRFMVDTIKPGNYEIGADSWRPAHVHLMFAKPGFASFPTQIYFAGDPYLPPNDGCSGCGSDDAERIVELSGDAATGWMGTFRIVLAST